MNSASSDDAMFQASQEALLPSHLSPGVGEDGVLVLVLPGDAIVRRALLAAHAHVLVVVRVPEAVEDHLPSTPHHGRLTQSSSLHRAMPVRRSVMWAASYPIEDLAMAQPHAGPRLGQVVGDVAHALEAAGHDDVSLALHGCPWQTRDANQNPPMAELSDNCPPAPTSMMLCAASATLFMPEAHTLLTVRATVDLGRPVTPGNGQTKVQHEAAQARTSSTTSGVLANHTTPTCEHGGLARRGLTDASTHNVPEDHLLHILWLDACRMHSTADDPAIRGPQILNRPMLKAHTCTLDHLLDSHGTELVQSRQV